MVRYFDNKHLNNKKYQKTRNKGLDIYSKYLTKDNNKDVNDYTVNYNKNNGGIEYFEGNKNNYNKINYCNSNNNKKKNSKHIYFYDEEDYQNYCKNSDLNVIYLNTIKTFIWKGLLKKCKLRINTKPYWWKMKGWRWKLRNIRKRRSLIWKKRTRLVEKKKKKKRRVRIFKPFNIVNRSRFLARKELKKREALISNHLIKPYLEENYWNNRIFKYTLRPFTAQILSFRFYKKKNRRYIRYERRLFPNISSKTRLLLKKKGVCSLNIRIILNLYKSNPKLFSSIKIINIVKKRRNVFTNISDLNGRVLRHASSGTYTKKRSERRRYLAFLELFSKTTPRNFSEFEKKHFILRFRAHNLRKGGLKRSIKVCFFKKYSTKINHFYKIKNIGFKAHNGVRKKRKKRK